jgi:predicted nucleic acid-binding protein
MVTSLSDYRPKAGEQFFIDTNVWLFLYAPIANFERKKQEAYADFVNYLLSNKGVIVLPAAVLSEISNRFFGDAFRQWSKKPENAGKDKKKDFIPSEDYQNHLASVRSIFREIQNISQRFPDDFNSIKLDEVIQDMKTCSFADAYYLAYARARKLIIITDDGDLKRLHRPDQLVITFKK